MGQQTSATKSIPELFRDADEIIYEDINGLMEHVEEDYPDLYAQFDEAKKMEPLAAWSHHDELKSVEGLIVLRYFNGKDYLRCIGIMEKMNSMEGNQDDI
ncbi:MAG: hypothetical protein M1470_13585 [Bacteroidetes bacterium]|nr:hypothetical protein [Bacteroidota bacterium]MCL5738454.1 hypothetical protein [Bacteroidota bacterium]